LRRYNFRKPRREAGLSEQVDHISIFDYEEKKQKDDLQQEQKTPLHQEEPAQNLIPEKVYIPSKKTKRTNPRAMACKFAWEEGADSPR
jgi:hypothetical protein